MHQGMGILLETEKLENFLCFPVRTRIVYRAGHTPGERPDPPTERAAPAG